MNEIHQFGVEPLSCHSFSSDRSLLALSPNNNEVHIYAKSDRKWVKNDTLSQHELRITSIDWAPITNRIVTCSADRNAYVWSHIDGIWKPSLVILRINRAATCVRWSPKENKFAVGCGAKIVNICYFEEANNWWISKHIKKPIKSTVTAIDWHPNNLLLACGSTDYKTRIFSTFIKEVDQNSTQEKDFTIPWGGKLICGNLIGEWGTGGGGWVHDVRFSPDGSKLAWVSHDCTIAVLDATQNMNLTVLRTRYLPFLSCIWSSNESIIAAGHDCCPMLFTYNSIKNRLIFVNKIDKSQKKESDSFSAMRKFKDMDRYMDYKSSGSGTETLLETIHQNSISEMRIYQQGKTGINKLSTIALDGKMVVWDLKDLSNMLSALKI